jgi:hypothetical protein
LLQGHVEDAEAKKALCRADTLLNMKHGMVRLDNVWGVGGGIKPVKYLVSSGVAYFLAVFLPVFWIRIHLIWIWIQHFRLNTDLDPIRIQGFEDKKKKKKPSCFIYIFRLKIAITSPASIKDV